MPGRPVSPSYSLAEAIRRMRAQEVHPVPGYDGCYGVIKVFQEGELHKMLKAIPAEAIKPVKRGNQPKAKNNDEDQRSLF